MSTALDDCLQFLETETNYFVSPTHSMKRAIFILHEYEDKKRFLDKLIDYQEHILKWAILNDKLSEYSIARMKRGVPIRDLAEEVARANMSQAAGQVNENCPECSDEWKAFLIGY